MANITTLKNNISKMLLILSDIISITIILKLSFLVRINILPFFINLPQFNHQITDYIWTLPLYLISFLYHGLYTKTFSFWDEIKEILKSILTTTFIILIILFSIKKVEKHSRLLIIIYTTNLLILIPLIRTYIRKILFKLNLFTKKALIIGSGKTAFEIYNAITHEPNLCYKIAGFIDDSDITEINGIKVHKGISKINSYITLAHITDVIIAKDELDSHQTAVLINKLQHKVENVLYIPPLRDISAYSTNIKYFFSSQIISFEIKNNLSNKFLYITKRLTDYTLTLLILPLILPIMALIAIIIRLDSKGPVIYSHKRIGKNAKEFKCYKFRTMYVDADKKLKEILEKDPQKREEWQKYWKLKDDPRVTKIGKFLRKTSLDELPQIFNVLKGEMTLVGPRPVVKKEIEEYYKNDAYFYFMVLPGITGLWQVSGRSDTSYDYRVMLDSWYVKNWNLWLDIVILFKTFKAVFKREGAC